MDKMTMTRLKYVLQIWEIICAQLPDVLTAQNALVQDKLLPAMFMAIGQSNKATNKKAHNVFTQLFGQTALPPSFREEVLPFYLKTSLDVRSSPRK
jgi:hypothetical protein